MRLVRIAAVAGAALAAGAGAQNLLWVGKPDTSKFPEVAALVAVRETSGKLAGDPATIAAKVSEGGAAVPGAKAAKAEGPLSVVLVLERTKALEPHHATIEQALEALPGALYPEDKAALVTFGNKAELANGLTTSHDRIAASYDPGAYAEDSALFDGLRRGIGMASSAARPLVVAITSAPDKGSKARPKVVLAQAQDAGVPLYTVALGGGAPKKLLHKVALLSGGRSYRLGSLAKLGPALKACLGDYRKLHRVAWTSPKPEPDGADRAVEVAVEGTRKPATRSYPAPGPPEPEPDPAEDAAAGGGAGGGTPVDTSKRVPIASIEGPEYNLVGYGPNGGDMIELGKDKHFLEVVFHRRAPKGERGVYFYFWDKSGSPLTSQGKEFWTTLKCSSRAHPFRQEPPTKRSLGAIDGGAYRKWSAGQQFLFPKEDEPAWPCGGVIEEVTMGGMTYPNVLFYVDGDEYTWWDRNLNPGLGHVTRK